MHLTRHKIVKTDNRMIKKIIFLFTFCLSFTNYSSGQNGFIFQYFGLNNESDTTSLLRVYCKQNNSLEENFAVFDTTRKSYTLHLGDQPKYNYRLLDNYGNYAKEINRHADEYIVKFETTETINGYQCSKISIGLFGDKMDNVVLWISKDVKGYENFLNATVNEFDFQKLSRALKKINLEGIPIRILYLGSPTHFRYDFLRVDIASVDNNLFDMNRSKKQKKGKGHTKEELKKQNKITDEQYEAMKQAEEAAKKASEESQQKK